MMKSVLYATALALFVIACNSKAAETTINAAAPVQVDNLPGECPYLTKDEKGATVLSWVRTAIDSSKVFCYAVSNDGKTFSSPVIIPGSNNVQPHGENLPKVIFKPSGEIIAVWGTKNSNPKNKYSGLVFYTQSFDKGKTWTAVKPLVSDTSSFDQRYFDVSLLPNGEAAIIWLDNRKTTSLDGSGLYFASTNGKNGFEGERLISQPCCQCCRTDLYVDKKGGIHAVFRGIVQDSIRDMVHTVSTDGGKTFSAPKRINEDNWVIDGCPHTGPAMTDNDNGIHFAWFTGGKTKGCFYTGTADNGKNFTSYDSVTSAGSHPQITALANGELAIVWDEVVNSGDKTTKRIGIQRRTADGKNERKDYLTTTDMYASYPVILPLKENALVAFTMRKNDRSVVAYQTVAF
jgi:hypothetical protein